jgi:hypothetical protein
MQPDDIKQWLELIHGGGDFALAIGLFFANRIAKSVRGIAKDFNEMHDGIKDIHADVKFMRERTEKNTLRLDRIHANDYPRSTGVA